MSGKRRLWPVALAAVVTLALGGASVARASTIPPLDAHIDLEFSLDGATWADAPDEVLGSWGCGALVLPDPHGAIGGTNSVDPCSMAPGESITRTYHVRNVAARTGRFSTGVGEYEVTEAAEFDVRSTITGAADSDSKTVPLYGPEVPGRGVPTVPGSTVATLHLAPGQAARVVDMVEVPTDSGNFSQRQKMSPMMWISFTAPRSPQGWLPIPGSGSGPGPGPGPGAGTIAPGGLTPRTGAPPADWTRANSQVRGPLAETGADVFQLLLWALTAAGVGVTLYLLATRRRGDGGQPSDN